MIAAVAAVVVVLGSSVGAQVFSPGPLTSAHKAIDGLTQCTKCHEGQGGGQHSNPNCIACHSEIGKRIDAGQGFHARNKATFCAECHKEHKGGDGASLIDWPGGKHGFNHGLTGWGLQGAHKKVDCAKCHEGRRIVDEQAKKFLVEKKRTETFLGLSTSCAKCHFDEHRGQEGANCEKCHTPEAAFKEAPLFAHRPPFADFVLKGKHKSVACAKCHDDVKDETTPADAFPPPRARDYMQMQIKGVGQNSCIACHEDVHHGEFGKNCVKCHSEDGWKIIKQSAQDTGFHDKTDFPLRGEHTSVACKACHGPFPALGQAAVFKGLKHAHCADCHADAHEGQIAAAGFGGVECEKCHNVNGFTPALFEAKNHVDTRFPLEGSHKAVACNLCHKIDKSLPKKFPSATRAQLSAKGRPVLVSDVRLAFSDFSGRCEACHQDTHAGQFSPKEGGGGHEHTRSAEKTKDEGCIACHSPVSWSDMSAFKHDDTAFALTGKHKDVACGACHFVPPDAKGRMRDVVAYRGVDSQCAQCHADQHVGQLAKDGVTTCETCHATKGWKPATFDHDKQSSFPLEGKHKDAKCVACHQVVDTGALKTAKYKPLPKATECAGCHDDEHKGAFDNFVPVSTMPPKEERCSACHTPKAWSPAKIAHDKTEFPLLGKHTGVGCGDCHGADTERPIPTSCAGCHQDPHAGEFGLQCRSCHSEDGFSAPNFPVDAHRKTNFPLTGRHAAIPCEECHLEKRERTFTRASVTCVNCHQKDALRATAVTVSHQRAPFTGDCRACHQPVAFTPASYVDHERCFPIARGVHAPVSCAECHGNLAGVTSTGTCANVSVKCAECHTHNAQVEAQHHKNVPGYEHKSQKCAACHRAG